ncbi:MAG: DUF2058 domain-containing protein [Gammaproteobacteria bacterium]|nr:DUF2058 domain-containing protein [Gammaproteobacteria bacterium]
MAGSLRDQLLGAGLVSKDQANRSKAKARKKAGQMRKQKQAGKETEVDQAAAQRTKAIEAKKAKDMALNRERELVKQKKALKAQVRDILRRGRKNRDKASLLYNFVLGKVIKTVAVNAEQNDQLARGVLAIVVFDDRHHVISRQTADRLLGLDSKLKVVMQSCDEELPEEDDPYADYQVPDDLNW